MLSTEDCTAFAYDVSEILERSSLDDCIHTNDNEVLLDELLSFTKACYILLMLLVMTMLLLVDDRMTMVHMRTQNSNEVFDSPNNFSFYKTDWAYYETH